MAQLIREVMRSEPVCLPASTSVTTAAKTMADAGIGDVIVRENGRAFGIVTDRDIVVRVIAQEMSPDAVALGDICSRDLISLSPNDSVDDAVRLMSENALRRIPVVDGGRPIGIISLGDLALEREPESPLAAISGAPPNN